MERVDLEKNIRIIELKYQEIQRRNSEIATKLEKQNKKFHELYDGFIALNYVKEQESIDIPALLREEYHSQFKLDYDSLNDLLQKIELRKETELVENCEKHIISMYEKLHHRWDTIIAQQKLRAQDFAEIEKQKTDFIEEGNSLDWEGEIPNDVLKTYYDKIQTVNKKETELLELSEFYVQELEHLLNVRETLFAISHELFAL